MIPGKDGWHRLAIDVVRKELAGLYSVEAANDTGEAKSVATLTVNVPATVVPAAPTPTPPPPQIYQQQTHEYSFDEFQQDVGQILPICFSVGISL